MSVFVLSRRRLGSTAAVSTQINSNPDMIGITKSFFPGNPDGVCIWVTDKKDEETAKNIIEGVLNTTPGGCTDFRLRVYS